MVPLFYFQFISMKKMLLFFSLLLSCNSLMAQHDIETFYLKNGSIIKGEIIEQVPNQSIKVRTKDGSVFVYNVGDVQKITKEDKNEMKNSGHRGLDFSVDLGYNIATKGGGGTFSTEIGIGKRFTKNFYWGIGSGAFIPTKKGGNTMIPVNTDFKVYFPLNTTSIVPNGTVRFGYIINTADEIDNLGKLNYIMLQIMPGIQIPLSKKVDVNFSLGYTHYIPTINIGGSGAFTVKVGFDFHKSLFKTVGKSVPTRNKGMQFTLEAGSAAPWLLATDRKEGYSTAGGALVATYKLNPNISFGVGYGFDYFNTNFNSEGNDMYLHDIWSKANGYAHNIFVRGQYRLTNRKISPFASCDAGIRKYSYTEPEYIYTDWNEFKFNPIEPKKSGFFIAPAIGISIRTTNNSYLDIKAGYDFASAKLSEQTATYEDRQGNSYYLTYKSASMSALFVKIGFTHTFKLGSQQ